MKIFIDTAQDTIKLPEDLDFGEGVEVRIFKDLTSEEAINEIGSFAGKEKIVIAGASPRVLEAYFDYPGTQFVNIREQVTWPGHSPEKIKDLIAGAVAVLKNSEPSEKRGFEIKNKKALVIGAGVAGLETARKIAKEGFKVYLIEKKPFVGGTVGGLDRLYPRGTPNSHVLYPLINEVVGNSNIEIITNAELIESNGIIGDYQVRIKKKGNIVADKLTKECIDACPVTVDDVGIDRKAIYHAESYPDGYGIDFDTCTLCGKCQESDPRISLDEEILELDVGAIVVATGLKSYDASKITEYGYGKYPNVLTQWEFERKFTNGLIDPKKVSIIHCAGSRDCNHLEYCSRVCCMLGLKEAKLIKDTDPEIDVTVHYIDMRSYGPYEEFYNTLRKTYGVKFIQGRPAEILNDGNELVVRSEDIQLGKNIDTNVDHVVLMTGYVPDDELFKKLGLPGNGTFPTEYVNSCHSVDSNPRGILFAGAAAYPKGVAETMSEAGDVSGSVIEILSKDFVEKKTPTARINSTICGENDCRICLTSCPYGAVHLNKDEEVTVNEELCMGCGICTATCASGANQLEGYIDRGMIAQVDAVTKKDDIVAFLCKWSSYSAADKAGYEELDYPENVKVIRIPCTGRVDAQMILQAFSSGAKGVLIGACPPDACHYFTGNFKARKRVIALKALIKQFGISPDALRIEWIGKEESKKFTELVNELDSQGGDD